MKSHSERCRECKARVKKLLESQFGVVEVNWGLNLPCNVRDYNDTKLSDVLGEIHEALQQHRQFENFVYVKKLPRVDYYIPQHSLIVEFDESQHFTKPRDIALGFYPQDDKFGFSIEKWRTLCRKLNKRDDSPPYRDEQRAWYDTLRDFAPLILGNGRILRLYSRDSIWCSLDSEKESDTVVFRRLLSESLNP